MSQAMTAEELFLDLKRLPQTERQRFFAILSENIIGDENAGHEELFGHFRDDLFSANDAAEYLEISMTTLRRYVKGGKLVPAATVGRNQMFAASDLKTFKRALRRVKGS